MEQMIKINVSDGMEAVWNDKLQKIEFKKKESWRDIKTFDDVLNYLGIEADELYSLYSPNLNKCIPFNKWQLIMETFIKASNDQCRLSEGDVYVPYCCIVYNDKYPFDKTDIKICSCIINNRECTLIGGRADHGSLSGLGFSASSYAAVISNADIVFCGFSSREVAEHVSRYFAKELVESTLGWRINEIKWL